MMTTQDTKELVEGILNGVHAHQLNILTGDHAKVVYQEVTKNDEQRSHFPLNKTKEDGVNLYNFLSDYNYMKVPLDSWLYLMGFVTEIPGRVVPIMWLTTKEQLRTMLRLSFENLIHNNSIKIADLERLTPKCFVDNNGKPMNLPKAKTEYSSEIDRLKDFFRPSSDL